MYFNGPGFLNSLKCDCNCRDVVLFSRTISSGSKICLSARQICHVVLAKRGRHPATRAATLLRTAALLPPVPFYYYMHVCVILNYNMSHMQLDTSISVII